MVLLTGQAKYKLGDPGATSWEDAIFQGERAPGHSFLPNQFQKSSNSSGGWIGQKTSKVDNCQRVATRSREAAKRQLMEPCATVSGQGRSFEDRTPIIFKFLMISSTIRCPHWFKDAKTHTSLSNNQKLYENCQITLPSVRY